MGSVSSRAILGFIIAASIASSARQALANDCRGVDGPFTSSLVPPPTCTSPVGLCTHGIFTGDFAGTYDFTFQTMAPVPDHPGRFFYTGQSVITPARGGGQLFSDDHGYLDMGPGSAPFVTTVLIARGSGRYASASGTLVAQGTLDLTTGQATGSYTGAICRPDGDGDHDGDR